MNYLLEKNNFVNTTFCRLLIQNIFYFQKFQITKIIKRKFKIFFLILLKIIRNHRNLNYQTRDGTTILNKYRKIYTCLLEIDTLNMEESFLRRGSALFFRSTTDDICHRIIWRMLVVRSMINIWLFTASFVSTKKRKGRHRIFRWKT